MTADFLCYLKKRITLSNLESNKQDVFQAWEPFPLTEGVVPDDSSSQSLEELNTPNPETELLIAKEAAKELGFQQGFDSGYAHGFDEGKKAGHESGHEEAFEESKTAFLEQRRQLHFLISQFEQDLNQKREIIASDILSLCLEISQIMIRTSLSIKPDLVIPLIQDLIKNYPTLELPGKLFLHPNDAKLVVDHMDEELQEGNWRIIEDPTLTRGECYLETHSNLIDCRFKSRWEHIQNRLNQSTDWLV